MKVILRPLEDKDAYISVKWRNEPEIWNYTLAAGRGQVRVDDELKWIRRVTKNADERRFAIEVDDVYVGNVYLTGIGGGAAEYHIVIGEREYWGKGIAREATNQILTYARDILALRFVNLIVHPGNEAARSLYQSLGFEAHGSLDGFISMSLSLRDFAPAIKVERG